MASQVRVLEVSCALLKDAEGRYFLARRASWKGNAGCWEFPGGKLEAGEVPELCAERELYEEFGVHIRCQAPSFYAEELSEDGKLRLYACPAELRSPFGPMKDHDSMGWFSLDEAQGLPMTKVEASLIGALKDEDRDPIVADST